MGDILGGLIGGVGSLLGGNAAKKQDLTGYNYLTGQNGVGGFVGAGNQANNTATALLTGGPNSAAAQSAFGNYLNSTGYNFQQKQGQQAITGSAAARGMLNSGGTAKALAQFGQGLGANYFNNYLNQLGGVAGRGLEASGQIGQAGASGGIAAGKDIAAGYGGATQAAKGLVSPLGNMLGRLL